MALQTSRLFLLFKVLVTLLVSGVPIILNRFECIGQPYPYSKNVHCGFRTQRNRSQLLIGEFVLTKPARQIYGAFNVYTKQDRTQTLLYGTTVDFCYYLNQHKAPGSRNRMAEALMESINKFISQLLHPCPYEGLVNFTGTEIRLEMIPPYVLSGAYVIDVRVYDKANQTIVHPTAHFTLHGKGLLGSRKAPRRTT